VELCRGDEDNLKATYKDAIDGGILNSELREVILTSYLFDGYPTALEGFRILSELLPMSNPTPDPILYSTENIDLWQQRGEELCRQIYGKQFLPLMNRVNTFAPELKESMIVEGYGKVLSRPGLHIIYRELCVVSILTLKFRQRQLKSHILGALRVGSSEKQIDIATDVATSFLSEDGKLRSQEAINEIVAYYRMPK